MPHQRQYMGHCRPHAGSLFDGPRVGWWRFMGGDRHRGLEPEGLRQTASEIGGDIRLRRSGSRGGIGLIPRQQRGPLPEGLAVGPPDQLQRPAGQRFPRIPFPLLLQQHAARAE